MFPQGRQRARIKMKITNEADYRQVLQRRKAIDEHILQLYKEKNQRTADIMEYIGSDQWLADRGLNLSNVQMINSLTTLELIGHISAGGPAAAELKMKNQEVKA